MKIPRNSQSRYCETSGLNFSIVAPEMSTNYVEIHLEEELLPVRRAQSQIRQLPQQILLVRFQPAHELRILQSRLTLLRCHSRQHAHSSRQQLFALLRQRLPARCQILHHFLPLLRRKPAENLLAIDQRVLLLWRQLIPFLQTPLDLLLPLRRQILKLFVVPHEPLLLFRRHLLQFVHPFRRQSHRAAHARFVLLLSNLSLRLPLLPSRATRLHSGPLPSKIPLRGSPRRHRQRQHHHRRNRRAPHPFELENFFHYPLRTFIAFVALLVSLHSQTSNSAKLIIPCLLTSLLLCFLASFFTVPRSLSIPPLPHSNSLPSSRPAPPASPPAAPNSAPPANPKAHRNCSAHHNFPARPNLGSSGTALRCSPAYSPAAHVAAAPKQTPPARSAAPQKPPIAAKEPSTPTISAAAPTQSSAATARQIQTPAPTTIPPPALPPSRSTAAETPPPARGTPRTPSNALPPTRFPARSRAHPNNSPASSKFFRSSSCS